MSCCGQQMAAQPVPRTPPEALVSMPDETWCCLARMAYGVGRAAVQPDAPEWESLSFDEREDVAQTLKKALSTQGVDAERSGFMGVLVRIGRVMTNAA